VVSVAAGARHSLALTGAGLIYVFGFNKQGQLGLGDTNSRHRPTFLPWSRGKLCCAVSFCCS
jgi:alpha-tubulin suppressor-like RCC1 family protein